jgi:hypothetical protein
LDGIGAGILVLKETYTQFSTIALPSQCGSGISGASMGNASRLKRISVETLTPFVGKALGVPDLTVTSWQSRLVKGGWEFPHRTAARLTGCALIPDGDGERSWSLYLKIARKAGRGITNGISDPYQREALFYASGFFDDLPGGVAAPCCLGVLEQAGDVPWVFLEDVEGETYKNWPLARYSVAARHLGHLHGGFLTERPLRKETWADRSDWLRWQRNNAAARDTFELHRACMHPLSARFYASSLGGRARDLQSRHGVFSDLLCRLPLTMVHGDFHGNNLIARDDGVTEETVVIDWDFAGTAQMGIDTGTLIGTSAIFYPPFVAPLPEFVELVFESYMAGLRDIGWSGPREIIRFTIVGYLACIFGMGVPPALGRVLDEASRSVVETRWNLPAEEIVKHLVRTHRQLLDYGEEASKLIPEVQGYLGV